jgi:hypothetical protein
MPDQRLRSRFKPECPAGASGIAVKLVEFNKNKEVLWSTSDGLGHGIHHFQILTTNGVALPLDAVK